MRDTTRGPPPGEAALHEAALAHLARFSATRATLARVLNRRVDRWARTAADASADEDVAATVATARAAVQAVVARLVASGVVDDAAFAAARARRLARAGRSRRATAAHLAARGVDAQAMQSALPDDAEAEFAAAVAFARRRRIGPFRAADADAAARRRELAAMARAGFAQDAARRALSLAPDAAASILAALRQR